jgi:hypothetical protein
MNQYQPIYYSSSNSNNNRLPLTPNSISPPSLDSRDCTLNETNEQANSNTSESLNEYPQEITWLFFRDNKWVPFQSNNHYKIEQAFTLGGILWIYIYICVCVCVCVFVSDLAFKKKYNKIGIYYFC